jgi:tetratricopeptide (TPR) repeat protein
MFHLFTCLNPTAIWWLVLLLTTLASASPQSPIMAKCARALYRGDYAQAEQLAERHLQKYPTDVPARVMLGRAELAQGKLRPAFEELRKALALDPHNIDALYYLSFAARALSQQEYQRLFAMAPDSGRIHQLLAEAALEAEDRTEAEAEFQKALKANSRSSEVATELAELKRSQSKFDEAITYYTQAEQIGPLTYDIAYGIGACYTYKQDYPQATEWLRKAVDLAPDAAAAHFALGNALFQDDQLDAAIPELNTALRFEPRMKQAYFLLGRAYAKLGRQDEAAAAFKKLDELSGSAVPDQSKELSDDGKRTRETPQ